MKKFLFLLLFCAIVAIQACGDAKCNTCGNSKEYAVTVYDTQQPKTPTPNPALESIADIKNQMAQVEKQRYESTRKKHCKPKAQAVKAKCDANAEFTNGVTMRKSAKICNTNPKP